MCYLKADIAIIAPIQIFIKRFLTKKTFNKRYLIISDLKRHLRSLYFIQRKICVFTMFINKCDRKNLTKSKIPKELFFFCDL